MLASKLTPMLSVPKSTIPNEASSTSTSVLDTIEVERLLISRDIIWSTGKSGVKSIPTLTTPAINASTSAITSPIDSPAKSSASLLFPTLRP